MRDEKTERWLKAQSVAFEYLERVALADVKGADRSLANARLTDELNQDIVLRYAISMEEGDAFPPLTLFRADGELRLIAGHHRLAAYALAKIDHADAYLLSTTDHVVIDRLRRTDNIKEGFGTPVAEAVQHALQLVAQGYSVRDAAKLTRVSEHRLNERVLADRVQLELERQGVPTASLAQSHLRYMNGVRGRFLKSLAELVIRGRLTSEIVMSYARSLRDAEDDVARDRMLEQWGRAHHKDAERASGGSIRPPASSIRRLPAVVQQAERIIEQANTRESLVTLDPDELRAMIGLTKSIIAKLTTWLARLEDARDNKKVG